MKTVGWRLISIISSDCSENIFGYQDLKIDFLISASTLKAFVDINYSKKIDKVTSIYYVITFRRGRQGRSNMSKYTPKMSKKCQCLKNVNVQKIDIFFNKRCPSRERGRGQTCPNISPKCLKKQSISKQIPQKMSNYEKGAEMTSCAVLFQ